jgi:predicted nucleotidyltransferase
MWAMEKIPPDQWEAVDTLTSFLSDEDRPKSRQVAALVLGEYASTGRINWRQLPIEQIEHVIMSADESCQHMLDALRSLVDARECRRLGVSREARIRNALEELLPRIESAFIFGSAARDEQNLESDIDLMVIGEVTLKDLTPGLKRAEQELGRQVNVAVYSPERWREHYASENAFVRRVSDGAKIFVKGGRDELAAMAG